MLTGNDMNQKAVAPPMATIGRTKNSRLPVKRRAPPTIPPTATGTRIRLATGAPKSKIAGSATTAVEMTMTLQRNRKGLLLLEWPLEKARVCCWRTVERSSALPFAKRGDCLANPRAA